ncbi:hypothetical protein [Amycolatopsis orientalis]|uniref:hypothetical protein n=1 Tax=Amycolatopsis orientalis TaxID=31958 RepID=UPI0003A13467|nr:hypothetical protein [Amycolatopsis orientalis]
MGLGVFDSLHSRRITLTAPGAPAITMTLGGGFDHLAIWSPGDAGLLCVEPWAGLPSPLDYDGEFTAQPGLEAAPPRGSRTFFCVLAVR